MYGNILNMWSSQSYNLTSDLDVCMNPYGKASKDAYGNYLVGNNTTRKKDNNPDKTIHSYPDPKYNVGDINLWCLENGTIIVGRIATVYPAQISDDHIIRYGVNVLAEVTGSIYSASNNEICVTENMAIGELDPDTYSNTHQIGEHNGYGDFNPLNTTSDKPINTDFKCDIDDFKTDINDLRTDVNALLENQYKIEGDLIVAKQPELGISIDDAVTSDIKDIKESGELLDCTVNYCVDKIDNIQKDLDAVDHKTKQASKLSKLSLLGNLAKFL